MFRPRPSSSVQVQLYLLSVQVCQGTTCVKKQLRGASNASPDSPNFAAGLWASETTTQVHKKLYENHQMNFTWCHKTFPDRRPTPPTPIRFLCFGHLWIKVRQLLPIQKARLRRSFWPTLHVTGKQLLLQSMNQNLSRPQFRRAQKDSDFDHRDWSAEEPCFVA